MLHKPVKEGCYQQQETKITIDVNIFFSSPVRSVSSEANLGNMPVAHSFITLGPHRFLSYGIRVAKTGNHSFLKS